MSKVAKMKQVEPVIAILSRLAARRRVPSATYRLQMHEKFPFSAARAILPYLERLGVSDCYTSPLLKAGPHSQHGYDICDHNALNPELGSDSDYAAFAEELQRLGLGHVLDFVPNHMGVYPDTNPWWADVLENGPCSLFARFFDIDWQPIKPELAGKVLLPILGDQYGAVLERGELKLVFENTVLKLAYYDKRLPINPSTTPQVYRHGIEALQADLKDTPELREYLSIMTELVNLPLCTTDEPERMEERIREKQVAFERLERLTAGSERIRRHIEEALRFYNGDPANPASFDPLHQVLESQYYRLASWKTASHEINYRRFFDVNELAGVRMEWKPVFDATHRLVMKMLGEGKVTSLRLDHPDGLYDPAGYFEELQGAFLEAWVQGQRPEHPLTDDERAQVHEWRREEIAAHPAGRGAKPLYVVGEKILSTAETMPEAWRLDGSSGYDFLNDLNRLFINPANAQALRQFYVQTTGKTVPLDVVVYVSKRLIMSTTMASELNVLAHALNRISEHNRKSRDFTLDSLRDALREVVACFPVYRTYISPHECTAADRQVIDRAISRARRRNPAMESTIFKFVRDVLIPHDVPDLPQDEWTRRIEFSMKFQQYTGPVQAKGLEDTAFYRYNVLLSLNEVGGDPGRFGSSVQEFHSANLERFRHWPTSMLGTATHDTKRGEDARARLNVLSEIPEEWQERVRTWSALLKPAKTAVDSDVYPDANDEYLFYQALLGAWSFDPRETAEALKPRMQAYMLKAIKEAKLRTSWVTPNEEYESAVHRFVDQALTGDASKAFLPAFLPFARRLAQWGAVNSLSQVALKITSPGVPDVYQGCELWDLSLVDPDNRRPVDYPGRDHMLQSLEPLLATAQGEGSAADQMPALLEAWPDGRVKLLLTAALLRFRRSHWSLFMRGDYVPCSADGTRAEHCVSFLRQWKSHTMLVVTPRFPSAFGDALPLGLEAWKDTRVRLPAETEGMVFRHLVTGERVRAEKRDGIVQIMVGELLRSFPAGVLVREETFRAKGLEKDFCE